MPWREGSRKVYWLYTASKTKKRRTILITDGAGFIGSNTLDYLFHKYPSYKFIVLDALTYAGDIRSILGSFFDRVTE